MARINEELADGVDEFIDGLSVDWIDGGADECIDGFSVNITDGCEDGLIDSCAMDWLIDGFRLLPELGCCVGRCVE